MQQLICETFWLTKKMLDTIVNFTQSFVNLWSFMGLFLFENINSVGALKGDLHFQKENSYIQMQWCTHEYI